MTMRSGVWWPSEEALLRTRDAEGKTWDEIAVELRRALDDVTLKGYALGLRHRAAAKPACRRDRVKRAD